MAPKTEDAALLGQKLADLGAQVVDVSVVEWHGHLLTKNPDKGEAWGPEADICWADITGDAARSWGLPAELDPTWPLSSSRPLRLEGDDVDVAMPFAKVLAGMPVGSSRSCRQRRTTPRLVQ